MTRDRYRFAWAWTIGATLLLGACDGIKLPPDLVPKPAPTPTPAPVEPPPVDKHQPVCAPPGLVTACWHQPTQEGPDGGWLFIPATTQPTPPPAPPPAPEPPPVVPGGCVLEGESENRVGETASLALVVNSAIRDVLKGRCPVGGDCLIDDFSRASFNAAVTQRIRDMGYCAGEDRPGHTDEISVADRGAPGLRQKYHVFAGDDTDTIPRTTGTRRTVNWAPNSFRGTWRHHPQPPPGPGPTPTPTPAPGCNAPPCPRIAWTRETLPDGWGENEIGRPAWQFNSAPYPKGSTDKDRDFTPIQRRNPAFCEAVGFNAPVIADCPLGKDGDPLRPERERYLLGGGFHRESRFPENDASCEPRSGAPSMIRNGTTNCRMCDSRRFDDPLRVCSPWF